MDSTAPLPDPTTAVDLCKAFVLQFEFARRYTLELLEQTPESLWFTIPQGAPTHIAWQVGHLAVSQYGLMMFRQRGRLPGDLDLIPGKFRKAYGRQSVPQPGSNGAPTPEELQNRMAEVHRQAIAEMQDVDGDQLLEAVEMPYAVYPTKLGAIMFCSLHEQIHAGQIGILRRLLKLDPLR